MNSLLSDMGKWIVNENYENIQMNNLSGADLSDGVGEVFIFKKNNITSIYDLFLIS